MRKVFTIVGIGVAIVGVDLILVALSSSICPNTPQSRYLLGCFAPSYWYSRLYLGIALLIVGIAVALISARMKSKPSNKSIQRENEEKIVRTSSSAGFRGNRLGFP